MDISTCTLEITDVPFTKFLCNNDNCSLSVIEIFLRRYKTTFSLAVLPDVLTQACFFTGFAAIQDNGISLIMSLEKKSLSLGEKILEFRKKILEFKKE